MQHDDTVTLIDIALAGSRVRQFVEGVSPAAFVSDERTKSAVIHQLLVLGEAVKRLSPGFREAHPEIPWTEIAGMRDKLIHAYDKVQLERVVEAAYHRLPEILERIEPLVPRKEP